MAGIGDEFYQATKYSLGKPTDYGPLLSPPRPTVVLPPPQTRSRASLPRLLGERRSWRKFSGEPADIGMLSFILWASDGITAPLAGPQFRAAPSAGARHPIDTYVVANRVEGLERGVYFWNVTRAGLEMIRKGDFEEAAVKAAAGQEWIRGSVAVFIWIAEFARTTSRYKDRGYRYVFLDAGHICQNLYLACQASGLGMTAIAALDDDEVNALAGVDGRERSVVYMAALGRRKIEWNRDNAR